ncbi:MAG: diguanylate cyclase [Polyangiales bacterium]
MPSGGPSAYKPSVEDAPVGDHEEARFGEAIESALVDELYQRTGTSLGGLVLTLVVMRSVLGDVYDATLSMRIVFYVLYALIFARGAHAYFASKKQGVWASPKARHIAFGIGSTAVALGFLAITAIAMPRINATQLGLLAVCQTAINGVALLSLGSSPAIYFLYMLPNLLPFAIMGAVGYGPTYSSHLPLMVILYAAALSTMAINDYRARRDNVRLRLRVGEMALVDTLTKLRNRRYLEEFITIEVEQVLRRWVRPPASLRDSRVPIPRRKLWVMMIDLDHFKEVNDVHGHEAGDAVLQQAANILRDAVRKQDVVVRWGGEEFVVVCHDHPEERPEEIESGRTVAERIQSRMAAHEFVLPGGTTIHKTCSIGYSVFPFHEDTPELLGWEEILALADVALYEAKRRGRNRIFGVMRGDKPWPSEGRDVAHAKIDVRRASAEGFIKLVEVKADAA